MTNNNLEDEDAQKLVKYFFATNARITYANIIYFY